MSETERFLQLIINGDTSGYNKEEMQKMVNTPCSEKSRLSEWDYYMITSCTYLLSFLCKDEDREIMKRFEDENKLGITIAEKLVGVIYEITDAAAGYRGSVYDELFGVKSTDPERKKKIFSFK